MKIEVSNGELIDKLSILDVKSEMVKDENKLFNINKEKEILNSCFQTLLIEVDPEIKVKLLDFYSELVSVNKKLWNIEDELREKEIERSFSFHFVELARSVYYTNDKRADIKREINNLTNSNLIEEKEYKDYRQK